MAGREPEARGGEGRGGGRPFREMVFRPILAPVLRERPAVLVLLGGALVIGGAHLAGFSLWDCPFHRVVGRPCPGCGLTRGCSAFLHGDLVSAVRHHAFAPLFVLGGAAGGVVQLLPSGLRERVLRGLESAERRTGVGFWLIAGFLTYALTRLLVF